MCEPDQDEILEYSQRLVRVFYRSGAKRASNWAAFRYDGPSLHARFDHHVLGQQRATMYVARHGDPPVNLDAFQCALAEVFQDSRLIDRTTNDPWAVWWTPTRPFSILDLGSTWTLRAGANQALCTGDRARAREWARAIYDAFPNLDGLTWPSAVLGPGRNVVLTDRATGAVPLRPDVLQPLSAPGLLPPIQRAAGRIGYSLI
ncbi:MAG: RES family NAD+ phosphorylase [Acidimicrobiales bacterium]